MPENPISDLDETMVRWMVSYRESDLRYLKQLQDQTQIPAPIWMRSLLAALVESHAAQGSVTLPLAVVSRDAALRAGLLPEPGQRTEQCS